MGLKNDRDALEFIAVRWPRHLRQALKVAAASHNPPLTMTEYLQGCFTKAQAEGGLGAPQKQPDAELLAMMVGLLAAVEKLAEPERRDTHTFRFRHR